MKRVIILADAAEDIEAARDFYEAQEPGIGEYCVDSLLTDIERLGLFSGIHPLHFEFHRHAGESLPIRYLPASMVMKLKCSRCSI